MRLRSATALLAGLLVFAILGNSPAAYSQVDATTTTVSCSPATVLLGAATVCTATVTDITEHSHDPTGEVTFSTGGSGSFGGAGTCRLPGDANPGSCQDTFVPSSLGNQTIGAAYGGDSTTGPSDSGAGPFVLSVYSYTITVSPSQTVLTGDSATYTVTLTLAKGSSGRAPAQTLSVTSPNGVTAGTFDPAQQTPTLGGSTATVQITGRTLGADAFVITGNDGAGGVVDSATATLYDVSSTTFPNNVSVSVSFACASLTVAVGGSITCTLTATSTGGFPEVAATFASSPQSSSLGLQPSCLPVVASSGAASCSVTITPLPGAAYSPYVITGSYAGSSQSATLSVQDPTSTAIACSPPRVTVGSSTTCTVMVIDVVTASSVPTGLVLFSGPLALGPNVDSSCTLISGACSITLAPGYPGDYSITGQYLIDSIHAASQGSASITAAAVASASATTSSTSTATTSATTSATSSITGVTSPTVSSSTTATGGGSLTTGATTSSSYTGSTSAAQAPGQTTAVESATSAVTAPSAPGSNFTALYAVVAAVAMAAGAYIYLRHNGRKGDGSKSTRRTSRQPFVLSRRLANPRLRAPSRWAG